MTTDDENILGCESGDRVLPIYEEKNRVRKSHATVPLSFLTSKCCRYRLGSFFKKLMVKTMIKKSLKYATVKVKTKVINPLVPKFDGANLDEYKYIF